tara:strand:- start:734 stop:2431 length:1698 start_codon:yes stop_codon:yes gene_type:complete
MSDAFQHGWDVSKIDFRTNIHPTSPNALGYSRMSDTPEEYFYRTPIGKDGQGNLIYGPRNQSVKDTSFIQLPKYNEKNESLRSFKDPHLRRLWGFGPDTESTQQHYKKYINQADKEDSQDIISTIIHESMHDADHRGDAYSENLTDPIMPTFGNRGKFTGRFSVNGTDTGGILDKPTLWNLLSNDWSKKNKLKDNVPLTGSGLYRDKGLASETMAYTGQHPFDEQLRMHSLLSHSAVPPSNVASVIRNYGDWRGSPLPWEPRNLKGKKLTPKRMKASIRRGNLPPFPLVLDSRERIRRNLNNALNDTAMTRMIESGEFLEKPETDGDPSSVDPYHGRGKRDRTSSVDFKEAQKETSKSRNAINSYFRNKNNPTPNSLEDLPKKIQALIGQQQLRGILGRMRGMSSEGKTLDDSMGRAEIKLYDQLGVPQYNRNYTSMYNHPLEEKLEQTPKSEKDEYIREYLETMRNTTEHKLSEDEWGQKEGNTQIWNYIDDNPDLKDGYEDLFKPLESYYGNRSTHFGDYKLKPSGRPIQEIIPLKNAPPIGISPTDWVAFENFFAKGKSENE